MSPRRSPRSHSPLATTWFWFNDPQHGWNMYAEARGLSFMQFDIQSFSTTQDDGQTWQEADLAPTSLRGRYMAAIGLSWWVGLALAPTAAFLAAAAVATAAAISALALEWRLPEASRLTPHPRGGRAATDSAD